MRLKIDSAGRVVIPKPLRKRLGFHSKVLLEAREQSGGVLLTVARTEEILEEKDGLLLFTGEIRGDLESAIGETRSERLTTLSDFNPDLPVD